MSYDCGGLPTGKAANTGSARNRSDYTNRAANGSTLPVGVSIHAGSSLTGCRAPLLQPRRQLRALLPLQIHTVIHALQRLL